MGQRDDGTRRAVAGKAARGETARRLMVVRLRVQIARLEEEQRSDPRIGEARRELHALTSGTRDSD